METQSRDRRRFRPLGHVDGELGARGLHSDQCADPLAKLGFVESWRSRSKEDRIVGVVAGIGFAIVVFVLVVIAAGIWRDPNPTPPRPEILHSALTVQSVQTLNNYQTSSLPVELRVAVMKESAAFLKKYSNEH